MARFPTSRYVRRILFAIGLLALIDPLVEPTVHRLERARYESDRLFRFEASDLFAIAPVVAYLRENPQGERPRVVFFGNSVVWGYWLQPRETVPAQFQRLAYTSKVFNFGVNGFESGSAYLITKAVIDAIDVVYLFHVAGPPSPALGKLIPISSADTQRFGLATVAPLEQTLERLMVHWKLYRYSYRLQTALFGTSTRLYLYLNKGRILEAFSFRQPSAEPSEGDVVGGPARGLGVEIDAPVSPVTPTGERVRTLTAEYPFLWEYAVFLRAHRKVGVIVEIAGSSTTVEDGDRADLNAYFYPHVRFMRLRVNPELETDGTHLSPLGARAVAETLFRRTAAFAGLQ